MSETTKLLEQAQACEHAGFTAMAATLKQKADAARRMAIAYEKYRYVRDENVVAFQKRLYDTTLRHEGAYPNLFHVYDQLTFSPIETYGAVPPREVLDKVTEARREGLFDALEVAKIESTREYKDPIVFGRIEGCPDRFYVTQWDSDVSIADLIGPNEG